MIDVSCAECDLRALDRLTGHVVVCSMFEDDRPPRGVAGLIDWRSGGRLSALVIDSFLAGAGEELTLISLGPRLSFEKLVLAGLGPRAAFDASACRASIQRVVDALVGLRARRVAIELPGRHDDAVSPIDGFSWFFDAMVREADAPIASDLEGLVVLDEPGVHATYLEAVRSRGVQGRRAGGR